MYFKPPKTGKLSFASCTDRCWKLLTFSSDRACNTENTVQGNNMTYLGKGSRMVVYPSRAWPLSGKSPNVQLLPFLVAAVHR